MLLRAFLLRTSFSYLMISYTLIPSDAVNLTSFKFLIERAKLLSTTSPSTMNADLILRYDNEDTDSARPAPYALDTSNVAAQYGSAVYSTTASATQFVYGGPTQPLVRQPVEGSGFSVALKVEDGGTTAPYSLKGFQLEYELGARR